MCEDHCWAKDTSLQSQPHNSMGSRNEGGYKSLVEVRFLGRDFANLRLSAAPCSGWLGISRSNLSSMRIIVISS